MYRALTKGGTSIISVVAEDLVAADKEIIRQLKRGGRLAALQQWRRGGCRVERPDGTIEQFDSDPAYRVAGADVAAKEA